VPNPLLASARRALDAVDITTLFARAVLDGDAPGDLWADRPEDPRAFHVWHPHTMSLVWGPAVAEVADDVAAHVRARADAGRPERLQVEPRWADLGWAARIGGAVTEQVRLNFAFDAAAFPGPVDAPGARMRPATAAEFAWEGTVRPTDFWPDAETFLARGGGWVAEVDGVAAALAFAAFTRGGEVELGIETAPGFRRRGLARAAAAAMVDDLVRAGRTPVWACREDNTGSLRLARSLGFAVSRRLPYLRVEPAA
jgi:GNAT superfamily N-acetyltransferase